MGVRAHSQSARVQASKVDHWRARYEHTIAVLMGKTKRHLFTVAPIKMTSLLEIVAFDSPSAGRLRLREAGGRARPVFKERADWL